jgi:hypothetical protein
MDPVSIVVGALAAGAATALKQTAGKAVKDTYSGLKKVLTDGYKLVSIPLLEKDPTSKVFRQAVEQEIGEVHASDDIEVVESARELWPRFSVSLRRR